MPDEVLCHRLGLIPLNVDPKLLSFPVKILPGTDELSEFTSTEHLVFDFHVQFNKSDAKPHSNKAGKDSSTEPAVPAVQETFGTTPPAVVSDSILINKLAVGDEIEARCLAVKGIGRDHAKFSPVSAAYYKLMPIIKLLQPVEGELAKKLQACFAPGVIGVKDTYRDEASRWLNAFRHGDLIMTGRSMGRGQMQFSLLVLQVGGLTRIGVSVGEKWWSNWACASFHPLPCGYVLVRTKGLS
ncbi:unnamed protein product [Echinostoma caproni]|uniref:RPOLD domain-containing protein n=1 Tax=Echinostoma caproni TaxID=27848 RepID=A0A183BB77_9TREM|nr:unnamed protein product [Echinostoma caproni]